MSDRVLFGVGVLDRLESALLEIGVERVMLVTGRSSYALSGAEMLLQPALARFDVTHFVEEATGPSVEEVEAGVTRLRERDSDMVIGVGGSTVMDVAKMIALYAPQTASARTILEGRASLGSPAKPIVAIPTTAGGGSEATRFAVVYVDGVKHSVADPSILPVRALVDPRLTYSVPPAVTASTGFDALCQSIESFWGVHSTDASRGFARQAIQLATAGIADVVHRPTPELRADLARAAHLAGRAIDVTRTTAPHALSYALTSGYGLPHGAAVAMTLGEVLLWNSEVTDDDVTDSRGAEHVRRVLREICVLLGAPDPAAARDRFRELMTSVGLATRLSEVGVRTASQRRAIAESVNPERLANNPRAFSQRDLKDLLDRIA